MSPQIKLDWIKTRMLNRLATIALILLASAFSLPPLSATEYGDITAVAARTSDDYVRTKLADGSYPQETYAFGAGGVWGAPLHDDSIDKLKFVDVAHSIAGPLAEKNYLPAKDPKKTKLLIMVYWGMTAGSADDPILRYPSTMEGGLDLVPQRNRTDLQNAKLLGYDEDDIIGTDYGSGLLLTAANLKVKDLYEEIGDNRYFVVLLAYDFQLMWKEKKPKLLWETRFSIRQRGNDFDQTLAPMTEYASRYFGQDSHGLIRRRLPIENIKIDETKFIGFGPEDASSASDGGNAGRKLMAAVSSQGNLPQPLVQRMADYQREKDALQDALAAKMKNQPHGTDSRRAIDSFNTENAVQIARLKKEREALRTELAQLAVGPPSSAGVQDSMDSFLGELAAGLRNTVPPSTNRKP